MDETLENVIARSAIQIEKHEDNIIGTAA